MPSASKRISSRNCCATSSSREFARQGIHWCTPAAIHNHVNKQVRIRRLGPYLAQRRLRFLQGSPGTQLLVDQLRDFPLGTHDDGPDALEMALRLAEEHHSGQQRDDGLGSRLRVGTYRRAKVFAPGVLGATRDRIRARRSSLRARLRTVQLHNHKGENPCQTLPDWNVASPKPATRCGICLSIRAMPISTTPASGGTVSPPTAHAGPGVSVPFANEAQLADIRNQVRHLAATNEFAINGIENRVSYLVGTGHVYRACVRKGTHARAELETDVQAIIDEFLEVNHWQARQQEIVRRLDRDGEAFLRYFVDSRGVTRVRFVEPAQVATPRELQNVPEASFGIHTEPHDVESVLGYYIDGQPVDAAAIQHRKANVDANVKRGLPLYYPVRKNLRRIDKLLRNMSVVAEIQSAIALIRKHRGASRSGVEQFVADQSQATTTGGRTRQLSHYAPGTILDAPAGLEYDFPAAGIDASNFVAVLQAELRAVAARLVMPEFMFTSDASNSNYASTLVAEGPAVKMFQRLQADLETDDRDVMWRAVENAAVAGRLPADIRRLVDHSDHAAVAGGPQPFAALPSRKDRVRERNPLPANLEPEAGARLRPGAKESGDASGRAVSISFAA